MNCPSAIRWAVCRWITCVGAGAAVAICYLLFQPALAQEKAPPSRPAAGKPADKPMRSTDEAAQMAQAAIDEQEPLQAPARRPPPATTESLDLIKVVREGGVHMWAVYAILGVSVVSVAFAIERIFGLRRSKVLPPDLVAGLRMLGSRKGEFDYRQGLRLTKLYPTSSAAIVARAMLIKVGRPVSEIEHALSAASDREATRLYANVRWQNLAFNVAPMLGLAGTVHGMIIAFFVTAHMPLGANKMESLATGIYAALVCTFAGLLVAIPAGIMAHFFEGRILRLFSELDDVLRPLVPLLERFEGRPRFTAGHAPAPAAVAAEHSEENNSEKDESEE